MDLDNETFTTQAIFNDEPVEVELETGAVIKAKNPKVSFFKKSLKHQPYRGCLVRRKDKLYKVYSINENDYGVECELHAI
ncbi:MAG: hypothetical protein HYW48_09315 [Deltaproteobacteria bacterium]|nr:hypothetical protein [Deltaproteobacteria bacterium]